MPRVRARSAKAGQAGKAMLRLGVSAGFLLVLGSTLAWAQTTPGSTKRPHAAGLGTPLVVEAEDESDDPPPVPLLPPPVPLLLPGSPTHLPAPILELPPLI